MCLILFRSGDVGCAELDQKYVEVVPIFYCDPVEYASEHLFRSTVVLHFKLDTRMFSLKRLC